MTKTQGSGFYRPKTSSYYSTRRRHDAD